MKTFPAFNIPLDSAAAVLCRQQIQIAAPIALVWARLTELAQWPAWNSDISRVQVAGPLAPGTRFTWRTGGATIQSELHTVLLGQAFGWSGRTMGLYAVHNWTLSEADGVVTVSVEESMSGLLARLFKGAFNRSLAKGMAHWLAALKGAAEAVR